MSKTGMYKADTIPPDEATLMARMYEEAPTKIEGVDAETFVECIGRRVYIEFCGALPPMNSEKKHQLEVGYDGKAYREWRDNEIHFALKREKAFFDHAKYEAMRLLVVRAIVERGVELFGECKETEDWKIMDRTRNLRGNLKPYLDVQMARSMII